MKSTAILTATLIAGLFALSGGFTAAQATEEPVWELVGTFDDVEVRYYEPLVQARTSTEEEAGSSGVFRTLARYIFGGNAREQEIAMTAPVERSLASEENYMAFNMPRGMTMGSMPRPEDKRVTLHQVPARTVAVIQFSGRARDDVVEDKVQTLLTTLASHGIQPQGEVLLAQYNPPWTLPWNRRNEVVVEVPAGT